MLIDLAKGASLFVHMNLQLAAFRIICFDEDCESSFGTCTLKPTLWLDVRRKEGSKCWVHWCTLYSYQKFAQNIIHRIHFGCCEEGAYSSWRTSKHVRMVLELSSQLPCLHYWDNEKRERGLGFFWRTESFFWEEGGGFFLFLCYCCCSVLQFQSPFS